MTTEKHKCCERTANSFYGSACGKTAKVERNGKWYCGTHDPIAIADKLAKRNAKWGAEWNARQEAQEEAAKKRKEQEHRAACFPELLFALQYALPFIPENAITTEAYENGGRKVVDVIRAAIAKAEGANT